VADGQSGGAQLRESPGGLRGRLKARGGAPHRCGSASDIDGAGDGWGSPASKLVPGSLWPLFMVDDGSVTCSG
jgi:hypothetical protein